MNTHNGWIKLYRCLLDDAVCQKSAYFHLWVTLLLMAAHKEHEFIFNNEIHKLTPGQLITGRKKLSKLTGIRQSTVEDILRLFENAGKIRQQKNTKFRVISIVKWEDFQVEENVRQQTDSTPTASRQHADTYKNDKNEKTLSLREENSLTDFNNDNDPLLQDTLRKAKEYENEQRRIREMFHPRNP
jgi:DNA-binding transcriptional MocR family regulator